MKFTSVLSTASLVGLVAAHAGPAPLTWKRDNLEARDTLERRCGSALAHKRAKRAEEAMNTVLARRGLEGSNVKIHPKRSTNQDSTCLVTPEVTQGPYHVLGEIVRQNMTEDQAGVPLEISVDFIDINNCEPLSNYWIDMWQCNSTGQYAHYASSTVGTGGGSGGGTPPSGSGGAGSGFPSTTEVATSTLGPYSGADDPAAGAFLNTTMEDNETFLRAVYPTDENGHLTAYTIVPGWYSGRAVHFHIKVYPEGYIAENGTFVANSSAQHTGQFFFDADTMDAVRQVDPYTSNTISWEDAVANEDDQWYPYQSATGYDAEMAITWVGDNLEDGLIGSITVAVNTSYTSPELSTQYSSFNVAEYLEEGLLPFASTSALESGETAAAN
ncbi:aromatic compound dioxygenase [Schizophyllum commune H4-8]|uniref:aromatic compound dioxygenase n=1 Tax=Schizophyllum commune (strain H4-8 / FGSC 9210) TaxID=578458 RepID=UPI0021603210|nr:aromatic compound dioxygenase [Schizophyllum commune H4-8]KAI5891221.1 aromatic compound dioxygenase [Schizophyllum commune H4-8]